MKTLKSEFQSEFSIEEWKAAISIQFDITKIEIIWLTLYLRRNVLKIYQSNPHEKEWAQSSNSSNSISKNKTANDRLKQHQKEYEGSDREIIRTISNKKLKVQKSFGGNASQRSDDSLKAEHEIFINKRKTIRSEARNQQRNPSNDSNAEMMTTKELLVNKSNRIGSLDFDASILSRRMQLNFTPDEATKKLDIDYRYIYDLKTTKFNKFNDKIPNVRNSMTLDDYSESYTTESHPTYRLPSISPNSKLPSWFLQNGVNRLRSQEKHRQKLPIDSKT